MIKSAKRLKTDKISLYPILFIKRIEFKQTKDEIARNFATLIDDAQKIYFLSTYDITTYDKSTNLIRIFDDEQNLNCDWNIVKFVSIKFGYYDDKIVDIEGNLDNLCPKKEIFKFLLIAMIAIELSHHIFHLTTLNEINSLKRKHLYFENDVAHFDRFVSMNIRAQILLNLCLGEEKLNDTHKVLDICQEILSYPSRWPKSEWSDTFYNFALLLFKKYYSNTAEYAEKFKKHTGVGGYVFNYYPYHYHSITYADDFLDKLYSCFDIIRSKPKNYDEKGSFNYLIVKVQLANGKRPENLKLGEIVFVSDDHTLAIREPIAAINEFLNQQKNRSKVRSSYNITSIENIPNYKGGFDGTHLHDFDLDRVYNPRASGNDDSKKFRQIIPGDVIGHYGGSGWYYVLQGATNVIQLSDLRAEMEDEVRFIKTLKEIDANNICKKLNEWRKNKVLTAASKKPSAS